MTAPLSTLSLDRFVLFSLGIMHSRETADTYCLCYKTQLQIIGEQLVVPQEGERKPEEIHCGG